MRHAGLAVMFCASFASQLLIGCGCRSVRPHLNFRSNVDLLVDGMIGEDEEDKGMEMENDFEGEMFDVRKGDENDADDKVRAVGSMFAYGVCLGDERSPVLSLSYGCCRRDAFKSISSSTTL